MTTVVLDNVKVELTADQVLTAIKQLPWEEQKRVRHELQRDEWRQEFQKLLARIRIRVDQNPISEEEIEEEVRLVREARRARRAT